MRISIHGNALLVSACVLAAASAWGQQSQSHVTQIVSSLDVAVVYNPLVTNVVGGDRFSMQGGSVQVHSQFWRGLGVVADVSGLHSAHGNGSGIGVDLVTAAFGPRYTWSPERRRYALFGEFLIGAAHGFNSFFPTPAGAVSSANSLAWYCGGGANVHVTRRLTVRAFEADWMRTEMPNGATGLQNNIRVGAGVVFKFE